MQVVEEGSTYLGATREQSIPMNNANHHEICKFNTRDSNYQKVLLALKVVVADIQRARDSMHTTPTFNDLMRNAFAMQGVPGPVLNAVSHVQPGDRVNGQEVDSIGADSANGFNWGNAMAQHYMNQFANNRNQMNGNFQNNNGHNNPGPGYGY